jgi:adenylate cyclase
MAKKFEYTTLAHRYTAQFPLLTYVGTQVNFWIIANLMLVSIMHMTSQMISETFQVSVTGGFAPLLWIALTLGIGYGVILGLIHYYLDQKFFRTLALGKIIVFKTLTSLCVLILILTMLRYALSDLLIAPTLPEGVTVAKDESWSSLFWLLVIYYFFMPLLISFINQVNKKYGPGILVPLLLGRYRDPKEEERIFMFMDLKSSTATAEGLGHLKYSSFIRDCFADINEVLYPYRAQVYQYVGDEIVVTWPESEGIKNQYCIKFYFACQRQFQSRSAHYLTKYGLLPHFKAGAHTGTVTAVEIGEVKRDIAYHGDTLNTAARIQSVCNDYDKSFIVSKVLLDKVGVHPNLQTQALGEILLKGKTAPVELVSVEWIEKL